jgi:tyrosyl-tRNA synthetase
MSVPDAAMPLYWTLLLGEELDAERHPAEAKRELARRLVDRFAGTGAGADAEARFDEIHVHREVPEDIPTVELEPGPGPIHMPTLLAAQFGISSSEARRLIKQGAVKIDGRALAEGELDLRPEQLSGQVVQVGKRRFLRVSRGG